MRDRQRALSSARQPKCTIFGKWGVHRPNPSVNGSNVLNCKRPYWWFFASSTDADVCISPQQRRRADNFTTFRHTDSSAFTRLQILFRFAVPCETACNTAGISSEAVMNGICGICRHSYARVRERNKKALCGRLAWGCSIVEITNEKRANKIKEYLIW
jgi:hypothetical protein